MSFLLKSLLRGGKVYAVHITEFIITICTPHIINCYLKVHDHHPHRKHAIDVMSNIFTNYYYEENVCIKQVIYIIIVKLR